MAVSPQQIMGSGTAGPGFVFGGSTGVTPAQLRKRRAVLEAMMARTSSRTPQNLGEGIASLGETIGNVLRERALNRDEAELSKQQQTLWGDLGGAITAGGGSALAYDPAAATDSRYTAADAGGSVAPLSTKPGDENIYSDFIGTVKDGGLTNPYGLAAVAATGKAESGYSAGNAYRQWSDPSESGQAGMAGGIMSWRAGRLNAMREFAAKNGDDPNRPSARTQGAYFLAEDPGLVQRLNGAKSLEEAQSLMNNAWAFAGHDRPGGEAARRLSTAKSYLPNFTGSPQADAGPVPSGQSVQVASLDPSIGMDSALAYNPRGRMEASPTIDAALNKALAAQGADANGQIVQPVPAEPQQSASLAPLPPAQTVAANPVPPDAVSAPAAPSLLGFSTDVQQAAAADPGFDGFAQTPTQKVTQALLAQGGPSLPDIPAAPDSQSAPAGGTGGDFAQEAFPNLPASQQRVAHAVEVQQAQSGENPSALMRVLQSPYASDEQRQLAGQLLNRLYARQDKLADRAYEENNPAAIQQRRLVDAQIAAATAKAPKNWQKLDDATLFNPETGETRSVSAGGGGVFKGSSVEAQSLNGLVESGAITKDQALQLGAGKTITDPSTGAVVFMTPAGVFAKPTPDAAPQPFAPAGGPAPAPAAANGPTPAPAANPGMIPVTPGKDPAGKPTEQQVRDRKLYTVMAPELDIIDKTYGSLSDPRNQAAGQLPAAVGRLVGTSDFQRATGAVNTIAQQYLYSVSGASAPAEEVNKLADSVTPRVGDDEATIRDKLARLKGMTDAVRVGIGPGAPAAPPAATDYKSRYGLE